MTRKILCINPNTSLSMTEDIKKSAEGVKLPDSKITYVNPSEGPESIETYLDEFLAAIGVLKIIAKEKDNYDGFIIACGDDPGLFAAREITDKPVVTIGQSPMLIAPLLGRKFTILGTWCGDKTRSEDKIAKYFLADLMASVVPSGGSVLGSHTDHASLIDKLEVIGRKAIEEDGAEVLITTCAGLAGVHQELSRRLGVPCLEGVSCAVKLCETLIDLGLHTTRVGQYALLPETKNLKGFDEFRHLYWVKNK
ncbi:MAG TPA: aspartate/glutamate racemase family protein [Anaerolineales bacterium]|nr:aspartate/glutamate racemase family protein [Anaerolineales bacterium]